MAAKARELFGSEALSQPDAHGIYARLADRAAYKEYALATLASVLGKPGLSPSLAADAKALKSQADRVDADLQATLLFCYLQISKRLSEIRPMQARQAIGLADLSKQLLRASDDLAKLLHNVTAVAALMPLPLTLDQIEKARADLRHNRAEIAIAATQLSYPGRSTGNHDTDAMLIGAQEALVSIAHTLDTLEVAYRDMESAINAARAQPATVH